MTKDNGVNSEWVKSSEAMLSAWMNASNGGVEAMVTEGKMRMDYLSPEGPVRLIYRAMLEAYTKGKAPKPENIIMALKDIVSWEYLHNLERMNVSVSQGLAAATACQDIFQINALEVAVLDIQQRIARGEKPKEIRNQLIKQLGSTSEATFQDPSMSAINQREQNRKEPEHVIPFQQPWWDAVTRGGIGEGQLYAIGAPEKNRKTSVLRSLLMWLVMQNDFSPRNGVNAGILCFENNQRTTYWDFVAMLTFLMIRKNGLSKKLSEYQGQTLTYERLCNGYILMRAGFQHKWPDDFNNALAQAHQYVSKLPIFSYDRTPENGGLHSIETLKRVASVHRNVYALPGELVVMALDYAQLVIETGKIYEDMKMLTLFAMDQAQAFREAWFVLSQFNTAGKEEWSTTKSPPTKGGGELAESAHFYFSCAYDGAKEDKLDVTLLRARNVPAGESCRFIIHPASGLLLGPAKS